MTGESDAAAGDAQAAHEPEGDYVLGVSAAELERLARQHRVWAEPMSVWLDALDLFEGATVVDAGCGPGAALADLRTRVGATGTVVAVDRSAASLATVEARVAAEGWTNVRTVHGDLADVSLASAGVEDGTVDRVVLRWVLSFPPDPQRLVDAFARWTRPGGRLLVVDYDHDGVAVFPRSDGFEAVVRAVRALYVSSGGDPWIAGRVPALFDAAGFELESFDPRVLSGAPGDEVWRWVGDFLLLHAGPMVEQGLLTEEERATFESQWRERESDPHARFVSPIVVGAVGRRR